MAEKHEQPARGRISVLGVQMHPVALAVIAAIGVIICAWAAISISTGGGARSASTPQTAVEAPAAARSLGAESTAAPQPTIAFNTPTPMQTGKRMTVEGVFRENATMLPRWYYQDSSIVGAYTFTRIGADGQPEDAVVFGANDWLLLGNKSEVEVRSNHPNSVVKIRIINNTIEPERSNGREVFIKGWIISGDLTAK